MNDCVLSNIDVESIELFLKCKTSDLLQMKLIFFSLRFVIIAVEIDLVRLTLFTDIQHDCFKFVFFFSFPIPLGGSTHSIASKNGIMTKWLIIRCNEASEIVDKIRKWSDNFIRNFWNIEVDTVVSIVEKGILFFFFKFQLY